MSVKIPNGTTFEIAATLSTAKAFTAISNAKPAVLTAAAHGLANGDVIVIDSAWAKLNGRPARVIDSDVGDFAAEGVDTTSVKKTIRQAPVRDWFVLRPAGPKSLRSPSRPQTAVSSNF